jgi:hypothetical protein
MSGGWTVGFELDMCAHLDTVAHGGAAADADTGASARS